MAYTLAEQQSEDINWYFLDYLGNVIHVASGGGRIPGVIAERDERNRILDAFFLSLPEAFRHELNPELERIVTLEEADAEDEVTPLERYLEDFVGMAKRGLFSYDKSVLGNFSHQEYHLVAQPIQIYRLIDVIPQNIKELLYSPNDHELSSEHTSINLNRFDMDNILDEVV